jgi:hypothetical protein
MFEETGYNEIIESKTIDDLLNNIYYFENPKTIDEFYLKILDIYDEHHLIQFLIQPTGKKYLLDFFNLKKLENDLNNTYLY